MAINQALGKRVRQFLIVVGSSFIAIILAMWLAIAIIKPGPQGRIVLAAGGGGGAYQQLAETWKRELARFGVKLELRTDLQGLDALQALASDNGRIDGGVLKGGLAGSLQGRLATASERDLHDKQVSQLQSVGRLFYEPIWIFYRGPNLVRSLGEFKGRRIMVGTPESGTRRIATLLLKANGVTAENSAFIDQDFPADAKPLTGDGADVAFVALPPDAKKIQDLLRAPDILLMDFSAEAEAYITRFPFLSRLVMYRGSVEFAPDLPSADITLLATAPALVVHKDLHPALVSLLTHAASVNPKPGFDPSGEPILFFRAGQFPNGNDPEFEIDPDSRAYYKTGDLPSILRAVGPLNASLGIPFWVTAFAFLNTTKIVLLAIPILSIAIPLTRFLPMLYTWMIRQRLLRWYDRLKELEFTLDHNPSAEQVAEVDAGLKRIDRAVQRLKLPRHYSDQLYNLRSHIELVAQKLAPRPMPAKEATPASQVAA
jgi:TRAP-type uncharacterized transport system substrate-binding protein